MKKTKILLSGILGNGLEFYDFALFGIFISILTQEFIISDNPTISLMVGLSYFAAGFFARPLGALYFGYIGDKIGRKNALSLSIILIGLTSLVIGLLPSKEKIGCSASSILLLMRFIQGFSLGGENNGSAIFVIEHYPKRYSGLIGAIILTGGAFGTLLASFLGYITLRPTMPDCAWRLPFVLGFIISILGLLMRRTLMETPAFLKKTKTPDFPLKEVFKHYKLGLFVSVIVGGMNATLAYNLVVYLNLFMEKHMNIVIHKSMLISSFGLLAFAFLAPLAGKISDKIGFSRTMKGTCLTIPFLGFIIFFALQQGSLPYYLLATVLSACIMAGFNGPSNAYMNYLFPVKNRYSGIGLGYALGAAIFGGNMPLINTYIINLTQNYYTPALFLTSMALLSWISLYIAGKKLTFFDN